MIVENFTLAEWLVFLLVCGLVLFFMYPKTNGDAENDCYNTHCKEKKTTNWWEK